jgi:hypothetical protein
MRATRRELILRGGIAAGAVAAASALPASADAAAAAVPETDAELLARTLQIEQLLVFVYGRVLASNALDPSVAQQVRVLLGQERQHISFLLESLRALAGTAPAPPATVEAAEKDLGQHHIHRSLTKIQTQHDGMRLLIDVESLAEGAYFYAISRFSDLVLVRRAVEIMGCEAQHWTVLSAIQHPDKVMISVPYPFVEGSV